MADIVGGSVVWNLDVDTGKLSAGLVSAKQRVREFADDSQSRFSKMASSIQTSMKNAEGASQAFLGSLALVKVGITGAVGLGLKVAGELETMQVALETVTGSSEQAAKAMETIKQTAKDSPFFETKTLAEFTQLMAASGQSIDEAVASGIRFGDVAAAFGKGNYEMSRMGNTLSQVIGKGRADIIDFRELVNAGWVSVRTDTAEAMGVTIAQFEEMVSAGEVGYDQIAKAAEKFAGSAENQSNTLSATWQRLKESFSTTLADVVVDTGIFDAAKDAMNGLITSIESIDQETLNNFMTSLKENLPIIAGIIIGGVTPAIVGMVTAFAPLIPFIAIGAALGAVVKLIVDSLGGWEEAQKKLTGAVDIFINAYNTYLKPSIDSLWKVIKDELLPALSDLWTAISPVLTPVLKLLATIIGGIVIGALWLIINTLKLVIQWVTDNVKKFTDMVNFFRGLPQAISNALSGVKNAITQPFTDAWNSVKNIANNIKGELDKINPFHRNSPSLVDNVKAGVSEIIGEYRSLKNITMPSLSGLAPSLEYQPAFSSVGTDFGTETSYGRGNQYITFEEVNVNDQADIDSITRELGFMSSITPGVT